MERLSRSAAGALLVFTLVGCGGGGESQPTPPAETRYDGSWTGITSASEPFTFTVSGGAVTEIDLDGLLGFGHDDRGLQCSVLTDRFEQGLPDPAASDAIRIVDGAFRIGEPFLSQPDVGGNVVTGTFESATTAAGYYRALPCAPGIGEVTWEAVRGGD